MFHLSAVKNFLNWIVAGFYQTEHDQEHPEQKPLLSLTFSNMELFVEVFVYLDIFEQATTVFVRDKTLKFLQNLVELHSVTVKDFVFKRPMVYLNHHEHLDSGVSSWSKVNTRV